MIRRKTLCYVLRRIQDMKRYGKKLPSVPETHFCFALVQKNVPQIASFSERKIEEK